MHLVYDVQQSNKTIVINAITYTLLAGPVNTKAQQDAIRIKCNSNITNAKTIVEEGIHQAEADRQKRNKEILKRKKALLVWSVFESSLVWILFEFLLVWSGCTEDNRSMRNIYIFK